MAVQSLTAVPCRAFMEAAPTASGSSARGCLSPPRPSRISKAAASLLAVLFPTVCPICNREILDARWTGVCGGCWGALNPWRGAACACCGLPFASPQPTGSTVMLCAACRNESWDFDLARNYGVYNSPLREMILELKFRRRERWGPPLGALLVCLWPTVSSRLCDQQPLLIPVPLHAARQRERGFNQAELLARGLRAAIRRSGAQPPTIGNRCVLRIVATRPQSGLSHRARFENLRGAFVVDRPERVRGRPVALIDDVMTTGATVSACARSLKKAGASQVLVLTLARATPQFPITGLPQPSVDEPLTG
ncbi:MAG: ComF family protein [Terriglobia bacterium]